MSILDHFPGEPRAAQAEALGFLESTWADNNVFVVTAPVAVGKSRIAVALLRWLISRGVSVALTTPTNVLVQQYADEFPELATLQRRDLYTGPVSFNSARAMALASPAVLANYFTYVANKLHKDVLICDEAHNVLSMLQERWSHKLWRHEWEFPEDMESLEDFVAWAETIPGDKIKETVRSVVMEQDYVLEFSDGFWRGKPDKLLTLKPLTIRDKKPWLWPSKVRKIVLLSATMSGWETYELGLDRRKMATIEVNSPIPPSNRPVVASPVVNMAFAGRAYATVRLADYLEQVLRTRRGKGIIHATYDVAARMRARLGHKRLMWHERDDRSEQYLKFRASPPEEERVLVASGMGEGIDLAYDAARWQVLTGVPFPSLADAAVAAKALKHPEWYQWETVKALLQTIGRVCRAPDDYGLTEITDAQFPEFYRRSLQFWPQHVRSSVKIRNVFDLP